MYKVTDSIYRGKRPDVTGFAALKKFGITSVVSLEDDLVFSMHEKIWCKKNGLSFFERPMSEIKAPSFDDLLSIHLLLEAVDRPVFVHCKHGCDRTGYVIAAYRMLTCDWSFKDAWRELVAHGHKWYFLPWWIRSLWKVKKCIQKTGKK